MLRRSLPTVLPWLVLLGASSAAFAVLRANAALEARFTWSSVDGHFWVVSAAALTCAVLAVAASIAAQRARNARVLMLALAFLSMAGFFSVHGLATPGIIVDAARSTYGGTSSGYLASPGGTPVPAAWLFNFTGLSGRLAVTAATLFLAASAVQWSPVVESAIVRGRHAILGGLVLVIALYGAVGLRRPEIVPSWLAGTAWVSWTTMAVVVVLGAWAAGRYIGGYRRSGLAMYGAVALGAILLVQAQFSMQYGAIWQGTFWLYHFQLLAGFTAILWGVVVEYSRGRTVQSFAALTVSDALDQLQAGYTEPIVALAKALAKALEARDGYTIGHGERVAAMSVLIGQELRLPASTLRALAAGALLHDVGKIGIPDAILHKAGRLTDEEFGVIQEHPARGHEILRFIYSQQEEALVIRHHHEKWDGSGYPDGLVGEAIPLGARIAAVADVYDALRSNRSYRQPMTPAEAAEVIRQGAGQHFDPRCVEAFLAVAPQWDARYAAAHEPYAERREVGG